MANVLVLETDPLNAAVLADRLHVSGHAAILLEDPVQAISKAGSGHFDLAILDMEPGIIPGVEVIRQLRAQSETRSMPLVALSASGESADRLAALRAGADEVLSRPVDVEELLLRVGRLLGQHGETAPAMQGDLADHPTWELVQYIQSGARSGELVVHGRRGSGQLTFRDGRASTARWKRLQGPEALLAILDAREGRFRLSTGPRQAGPPGELPAEDGSFAIEEVLMQSAWLTDQLAKRSQHLPATGAALRLTAAELPPVDDELEALPVEEVFRQLAERPDQRLYDLIDGIGEAAPRVRLAVAWLAEQGVLAPAEKARTAMSTDEISSSIVLDLAIHDLLSTAAGAGFDVERVSYLVLAEPGVQPQLLELLAGEPGFRGVTALADLVGQLERGEGGRAEISADFGTLTLHVQTLKPAFKPQIEALVPECAGVLVWLDRGTEPALIWSVVRRLEEAPEAAVGVLVAEQPDTLDAILRLTGNSRRWRASRQLPYSLVGILRLLRPRQD